MHGKRLLFVSPLIAALVFASIGNSQASVVPTSVSAGDSHVTATSKVAPPLCRRLPEKKQKKVCANGYYEGFQIGAKCGTFQRGKISDDEAYEMGFTAGFNAGQRKCNQ